jgi:hypothetical protein
VSRRTGEFVDLDNHEIPSSRGNSVSANEGVCAGIWLLSEDATRCGKRVLASIPLTLAGGDGTKLRAKNVIR